ncbi:MULTISPECIES: hypothetical protein [Pectobacterium]|uniref:hypothetical protein n=1 Tax=Pectobacterium TaxID=122277 RepID=UPI0012BA957A|nr:MULTISPECIES: hypothetical protein [Pectobacterium]QPI41300.1 hypothetical protein I2D83_12330 [Pectobacterium aroidearum]
MEGNKLGGNYGVPANAFQPGNQIPRKHSAYAKYLDADELFEAVQETELRDELIFTRARALSVTKTLNKIMEDLQNAESIEARIELYDKFIKAEQGLDRNIAQIESIENRLSKLRKHPGKPDHSFLEIFRHTDYVPGVDRHAQSPIHRTSDYRCSEVRRSRTHR